MVIAINKEELRHIEDIIRHKNMQSFRESEKDFIVVTETLN